MDAARSAPPAPRPDLLDALVLLTTEGHRAAIPLLRPALTDGDSAMWTRRPALATMLAAAELWDTGAHVAINDWLMKTGRAFGSPFTLRLGLAQIASAGVALAENVIRAGHAQVSRSGRGQRLSSPSSDRET